MNRQQRPQLVGGTTTTSLQRDVRGNALVSSRLPRNNPGGSRDQNTPYWHPTTPDIRSQPELWHHLLDDIKRGVDEQRKLKDVRRIGQVVGKLEESMKRLNDQMKEFIEQTFSVVSSPYKVSINASY